MAHGACDFCGNSHEECACDPGSSYGERAVVTLVHALRLRPGHEMTPIPTHGTENGRHFPSRRRE